MDKIMKVILAIVGLFILGGAFYLLIASPKFDETPLPTFGGNENVNYTDIYTLRIRNIDITRSSFSPSELTINLGDVVKWNNGDSLVHTIVSDSGIEFDSQQILVGESYNHTFSNRGEFYYHCSIHPSMKGLIIVN